MSERMRQLAGERAAEAGGARAATAGAEGGPRRLTYPPRTLHGDLARGAVGLALTAGPLLLVEALLAVEIALAACAAIFALYLARTALRYRTAIALDGTGVAERALGTKRIDWDGLEGVKLRYYTTKRGRDGAGWLVLTLTGRAADGSGRRVKIAVESTLTAFDDLLSCVAAQAVERGIAPDETSVHNFAAAGCPLRLEPEVG